jgi:tetratricopeptide (TPR) repeat protein
LSPAELAKLEHAFASDPSSDAYRPLAEAYLAMGRFMEAMVVCKKGVKAHPDRADPRVLLARVYAEQGKDKKALEELQGALQVQASDKQALRMAGALQIKTGEADIGRANLIKAWQADPSDPDTLALLQQHKIETAAPTPAPVAAAPVAAAPVAPAATPAPVAPPVTPAPVAAAPVEAPAAQAPVSRPAAQEEAPRPARSRPEPQQARPAAPRRPVVVVEEDVDDEEEAPARRKAAGGSAKFVTLGLAVMLPLLLGGFIVYKRLDTQRKSAISKHLKTATEELKHDSYESYKKACDAAANALEVDPDYTAARGYLAYAYAIRWGEHGGGDTARREAEENLAAAKRTQKSDEPSSHLYAAEALIKTYGGQGKEALTELEQRVKDLDAQGRQSSQLYLTLGLIQMNAGDLERAKDNLEKAQALAADDPRVYAALGAVYRRRGQDAMAWANYDFALRYEKDHPESLLGKSLLMLEQDAPSSDMYAVAAVMIKKLLEANPPPSPRQLAAANLARSLLISRVSSAMDAFKPEEQVKISEVTGVPVDKAKASTELAKFEETGFTLDKQSPELLLIKGRRLLLEKKYDEAAEEIRKAIKMDGSRAQFYVELAKALMGKPGGEKEASEALVTALKTMGDSPKLLVMLGDAYRGQGKLDEALAQYQRAVQAPNAKNPEARLAMGIIYSKRSDWAKAQEALEKASAEFIGQNEQTAVTLTELGRVYSARNDPTKADETFQRALNANEHYAPAYFFYAEFLSKDKKQAGKAKDFAAEYLRRAPTGEYATAAKAL